MNKSKTFYRLSIAASSAVMVYFAAAITTLAQADELLKAEPVAPVNLHLEAKESLAVSFATLSLATVTTTESTEMMMVKQKLNNSKNQPVTLTKVAQVAE